MPIYPWKLSWIIDDEVFFRKSFFNFLLKLAENLKLQLKTSIVLYSSYWKYVNTNSYILCSQTKKLHAICLFCMSTTLSYLKARGKKILNLMNYWKAFCGEEEQGEMKLHQAFRWREKVVDVSRYLFIESEKSLIKQILVRILRKTFREGDGN